MGNLRKTSQRILPVKKGPVSGGQYDIYPVHDLGGDKIKTDYASLAAVIAGQRNVMIDGYAGILFDTVKEELNKELLKLGVEAVWWNVGAAMKPEREIDEMIAPFLGGDDPIFGFRTSLALKDFFDGEKLARIRPDASAKLNILVGTGAALAGWEGMLVYMDIPKNELQFRMRAGSITNIGASKADYLKKMYKRFYFVDWVVLNRQKKALLPKIDIIVDGQREEEITWMPGDDLRGGLDMLSANAFRVRPWFEPGVWGGQWIKEHISALPQDVPNYAWSFELIVVENGLIFSSAGNMLEVSFDFLMYRAGEKVVGGDCYGRFGDEFPLRMDYLDNFDGGNLSIQCHPQHEYAKKNFGEVLTQEETYYMLDAKDDALVYLGFQDDIVPADFEKALWDSYNNGTEFDVPKYVNSRVAHKHDLYLMPPGTLHSSGKNNLVLEISTTPYIFTFKMYDWLALDLDGNPRPLNIQRGMDNLRFDYKGETVEEKLVSRPYTLKQGEDWRLEHMPTHRRHTYDIHRYVLNTTVSAATEGKCHVLNLVEGEKARVRTAKGQVYDLSYAETLVISASAGNYTIENMSGREIMVVKAFIK